MERPITSRRRADGSTRSLLFRGAFFVLVLSVVVLEYPGMRELLRAPYSGIQTQNLVVRHVRADGPNGASDVRAGDEVIAVDGVRLRNRLHYGYVVAHNAAFAPQTYTILRAGERRHVRVAYDRIPAFFFYRRLAFLVVAFAFLAVGLWVYLRRPDRLGSLFAANCAILASFLTDRPSPASPALQLSGELVNEALVLFFPAVLVHFFRVFPHRQDAARRARRTALLYAVPTVLFTVDAVLIVRRFGFLSVDAGVISALIAVSTVYFGAYVLGSLALFLRNYRLAPRAQKQKLRVVGAGTLAGFVPFLGAMIAPAFTPGLDVRLESAAVVCLGFVPLTFAYAILKHGAIELNLVVRKSLVYGFLTGCIIAGYYAVVNVISDFMVAQLGLAHFVWMPLTILFLALMFAPARERIQNVVDRLFYRGEYVYRQEVVDLNRQLARRLTREEILAYFVERVEALLKPSFIAVYTYSTPERTLVMERAEGAPPELPQRFGLDSFLGRYFTRYRAPLLVEYLDPAWERRRMDDASRALLALPSLAICVPVAAPDAMVALVLLGEKHSGLLYRRADAELLETFAEQLALVLQNADLLSASLEQERLKREVMLARDIQLSLLPAAAPSVPGLELHGIMVSSNEVGGDYYDYFPLDEHRLAVAIGDVSGKGIPAAMLMASLRAVFKNAALTTQLGPAELNATLSNFLHDNAKPEQFATFFYGIFDARNATFTFSNAGQCPALLVRPGFVDRLGTGGLLLGVQEGQLYKEGCVRLESGDLVLLYTDGVIEQRNAAGNEYGETRLVEFLAANKNLPLCDLQQGLLQDVLAFGEGLQHDDITSVIACHKVA
ncbi:MAG: SpoIIE family protein phosphatase [Candidatus Krumholzibacteria bacterium]|nr:SpoIIE family protein phosphatase [Candidatus Krumholzibacteria bacterium]